MGFKLKGCCNDRLVEDDIPNNKRHGPRNGDNSPDYRSRASTARDDDVELKEDKSRREKQLEDARRRQEKCDKGCMCCSKCFLVTINVIFQIVGFLLLVAGIVLKTGYNLLEDVFSSLLSGLSDEAGSSFLDSLPKLLAIAAYVLIALGAFMLLCGILGCCGACCKLRTLLIVYVLLVGLVFLAKLIFIILLATSLINDDLKEPLKERIYEDFGGIADTSPVSLTYNMLMIQFECCGVESYREFDKAKKWVREYEVDVSGTTETITLVAPIACCKVEGSFPDITLLSENCTFAPDDTNSNINQGCWSSIVDMLDNYKIIVIGVYSGILIFEVLCMAVAIYVIVMSVRDEKAGKVNPWTD